MRRLIIADTGSKSPCLYDVGVMGGLVLTDIQETYLTTNREYYDQVNGAVVVNWNTAIKAAEYKSPSIYKGNGCHTLDDIMNYEA